MFRPYGVIIRLVLLERIKRRTQREYQKLRFTGNLKEGETTRPSPENLERWNIYSHEWKRSKNGRMEQSKAIEYESHKASSEVLKPRNIQGY